MKRRTLCLLFAALALPLRAQQPPQPDDDPFARYLYPPELIMAHKDELQLKDKQRDTIKSEVQKAQAKFFDLQWQMSEAGDQMKALLSAATLDEAKILDQADHIMLLERQIKRTHLALLVRLRNLLTPEQAAIMNQLRNKK